MLLCSNKVEELCSKFGFDYSFAVDKVGRSGGLAIMWRRNISVKVCGSSLNHIDVQIFEGGVAKRRLTCYYDFPERARRSDAWEMIRHLATQDSLPWCIFGDFNDLLYASDKSGKHSHPQSLFEGFRSAIEDSSLLELDLKGGKYTWEKRKGSTNWVRERLDRAFASREWWLRFRLSNLSVIHTSCSDHDPIVLDLMSLSFSTKQFRFRFENTWLKEQNFHEEVSVFWRDLLASHLLPKLYSVSTFMARWGRNFFHKFRDKVKCQKDIVNSLVERTDEEGIREYFVERDKLNDILLHEEIY